MILLENIPVRFLKFLSFFTPIMPGKIKNIFLKWIEKLFSIRILITHDQKPMTGLQRGVSESDLIFCCNFYKGECLYP